MSWFKDEVEDWDMVGKALKREMSRQFVQVTETDEGIEEQLAMPTPAKHDPTAKQLQSLKAQAQKILSGE